MAAASHEKHAVARFAQTKREWAFFITYMTWCTVHAARKSYSAAKSDILDAHWFRSSWYGEDQQAAMVALPDAVFFFVYTFGSFLGGIASDHYDVRIVVSTFLALSGVFLAAFGAAGFLGLHSLLLYVVLWGLQAFTQAFCWPGCIAVMGKWFSGRSRSTVMGSWTSASNIGNLLGTAVAAVAFEALSPPFTSPEDTGPGPSSAVAWSTLMVVLAILLLLVALLVFATLVPDPSYVPLPTSQPLDDPTSDVTLAQPLLSTTSDSPNLSTDTLDPDDRGALLPDPSDSPDKTGGPIRDTPRPTMTTESGLRENARPSTTTAGNGPLPLPLPLPPRPKPLGLVEAMLLPGVLDAGLSYAAIKAVSYTLFWWLPTLLKVSFTLTAGRANLVAMLFDLGQMVGSVGGGYASSHSRRPVAVIFFMIVLLVLPLIGLEKLPNLHTTCVLILLAGIFSGGPHNLLATAMSQDLGQQQHPHTGLGHGRVEAIATVASIVDAFGSLGAGVMQYLVGRLVTCKTDGNDRITSCDWRGVLITLAALTTVGGLCLSRMLIREAREPARRYSQ